MSYGLIYTMAFATLQGNSCIVEIEKEDYTGEVTELTPGSTPFIVDIADEEFIYTPTRFSTATMEIVGSDYLRSLFSTAYKQFRVTLKRNGVIKWCGYISPELYTQDYSSDIFTLEMECMSAMSVLEYIDYTTEAESKGFVSLWRIIQRCIELSGGRYNGVYIPHVYASSQESYNAGENVLQSMTISEQNFFDEDGKAMTLKEVLEEVCKFLNWTCVDWKGELYFVDIDHKGKYWKYDINLNNYVECSTNEVIVQDVGFAGADHSLDILPGYNKVVIKCSNYPASSNLVEDIDFDKTTLVASSVQYNTNFNPTECYRKEYKKSTLPATKLFDINGSNRPVEVDIDNYKDKPGELNLLLGSRLVRTTIFNPRDTEISEYNYEESIQVRLKNSKQDLTTNEQTKMLTIFSLKNNNPGIYPWGAFCISGSVMQFFQDEEMSMLKQEDTLSGTIGLFSLRVGKYYFVGNRNGQGVWTPNEHFFSLNVLAGKGFVRIANTKKPEMPYNGLNGYIMLNNNLKTGDIELRVCAPVSDTEGVKYPIGYYLKDLKLSYQKTDDEAALDFNNSDRIYENVLNEKYINALDDIEFKISSYNNDGACYSKVLLNDSYLTDNIYNVLLDKNKRPEELLITRIINHYSKPLTKLTQILMYNEDVFPFTIINDLFMKDEAFINTGGTIDFLNEKFTCIMTQV